jgi:HEAT repeat protein
MAAGLGGFAWLVLRPHEPVYQGKRLTAWLEQAFHNGDLWDDSGGSDTETALRAMSADALPTLQKMAGVRMAGWRKVWRETMGATLMIMARDPQWEFLHISQLEPDLKQQCAFWGFRVLRDKAAPAVPSLVRWLDDDEDRVRLDAAISLAQIGPAARAAAPALAAALQKRSGTTGEDPFFRRITCFALGEMGPAASSAIPQLTAALADPTPEVAIAAEWALLRVKGQSLSSFFARLQDTSNPTNWLAASWLIGSQGTNSTPAVPLLLSALESRNRQIQARAIGTLGQIHARPEVCVPALIPFLQASNVTLRQSSMWAIRHFGAAARPAIPAILASLNDKDAWVQVQATNALRKIAPEAAAQAGVKTK